MAPRGILRRYQKVHFARTFTTRPSMIHCNLPKRALICASALLGLSTISHATVTPASIFASNMVLQQDTLVNVWGSASAGGSVTVTGSWNNTPVSATADASGKWRLKLPTPPAVTDGTTYTVTIAESNTVTLSNVAIGEVWILSGQSNMDIPIKGWPPESPIEGSAAAIAAATHPNLRLIVIGQKSTAEPQDAFSPFWDAKLKSWAACTPTNVPNFSAVGLFFGEKLLADTGIPIGLIHCAWGGSSCQAWIPEDYLERVNGFNGKGPWAPANASDPLTPTGLWNGMMAPLAGFTLRGALWYQGETNVGGAAQMAQMMPTMIDSWRTAWDQPDMAFYFAQLAPWSGNSGESLPEMWEAHASALYVPNTGMVATIDLVDADEIDNIHPRHKRPIGERFALIAEALEYGMDVEYSGPVFRRFEVEGSSARLYFDHAQGLKASDGSLDLFEIAGANGTWFPATAVIDGETVVLSSPSVALPVNVRYAWSGTAHGDFFNGADLPAPPFRTNVGSGTVSLMGQIVRPAGDGFFVTAGMLFGPDFQRFQGCGVNALLMDDPDPLGTLDDIKTVTGANMVRIPWLTDLGGSRETSAAQLKPILQRCVDLGMVPVVAFVDAAGSTSAQALTDQATACTEPEFLSLYHRYGRYMMVDFASETSPVAGRTWSTVKSAAELFRSRDGGTNVPIMLSAPNKGTDLANLAKYGSSIHIDNLLFSASMWDGWTDSAAIATQINALTARQMPLMVGAFGPQSPTATGLAAEDIMRICAQTGNSYTAWAWSADADGMAGLLVNDGSTTLSSWGEIAVNGANGIKAHAADNAAFAAPRGLTYETWQAIHFPNGGQSGMLDNPDGDELANRLEYVWGTDPNRADADDLTGARVAGGDALCAFSVSTDALALGSFVVKASTDLVSWESLPLIYDNASHQWRLDGTPLRAELAGQEGSGERWMLSFRALGGNRAFVQVQFAPNAG